MAIQTLENTDLFSLDVDALAHGVNCQGVMGSGVALAMRNKYPDDFAAYAKQVAIYRKMKISPLGTSLLFVNDNPKMWIYNLFTQEYYGRDPKVQYASLEACEKAFKFMFANLTVNNDKVKTLAMPTIGAGYGNLKWEDVYAILEAIYNKSKWNGDIMIAIK